jgi:sugar (pentulose or hexulose) kinase
MSFIGIDLGTSFIKGAVLDVKARRLKHVQRMPFPNQLTGTNPLQCEYDPHEIVARVGTLIHELSLDAPDCEGMVMCSQMHGMVLMNDRGEAMSNCVSWRDQRASMPHPFGSGSYLDQIFARIRPEQRRQLGNELEAGRPVCFLFWLAEQGKLEQSLIPASLPDFVLSVLCGTPPGVEATNASAFGAFNLETLDWHHEVIEALRLVLLR